MSTEEQFEGNQSVESINQFYENNKNNIFIAGIALIILAAGIYYYSNVYKPQMEEDASSSFFMAERYYSIDSLNKALNGDGIALGMLDIADEFGSTKTGNQAKYYAGRILLEQGKYEEALDYLKDASIDDEFLSAQIITLQGDCKSELEQYEDAGDTYMKAANHRNNLLTTPYALQKAGLAYEEAKSYNDALEAYERLQEEYSETQFARNIEARIGRVKAKIASN
ncbi:MAG: tetratricopeptide repeat protein [Bacteroidia bacterium]